MCPSYLPLAPHEIVDFSPLKDLIRGLSWDILYANSPVRQFHILYANFSNRTKMGYQNIQTISSINLLNMSENYNFEYFSMLCIIQSTLPYHNTLSSGGVYFVGTKEKPHEGACFQYSNLQFPKYVIKLCDAENSYFSVIL